MGKTGKDQKASEVKEMRPRWEITLIAEDIFVQVAAAEIIRRREQGIVTPIPDDVIQSLISVVMDAALTFNKCKRKFGMVDLVTDNINED
jgi:hypothetical protein